MLDLTKEIIYQIYPRSFQDSNGDGIGDIQGIISRLDYLEMLGVSCLWLNPVYPSPGCDNGYDVADYKEIDPVFGNLQDMKKLIEEAEKRGMKIMLDMVFNHTSTEHGWFKRALSGEKKYQDYYFFKAPAPGGGPPTNWKSKFGGTCWEYVPNLGLYYLHLFDKGQADLNWENPQVRKEIMEVLDFWLELGVKGFRFDVINLISKRAFEDDSDGDGRSYYTDGPKVEQYLKEIRAHIGEDIFTVGELSSVSAERCAAYTKPENRELSMAFHFHHLKVDYPDGEKWRLMPFDFNHLRETLHEWDMKMQEKGGWSALFFNCHDQPRSLSRFGNDRRYQARWAKLLASLTLTRRGTPYIYQGEEIGMTNAGFECLDDYRDVESLNSYQILRDNGLSEEETLQILAARSRDNARTPMQWRREGGFTEGEPWISENQNKRTVNVEDSLKDPESVFHFYRELIRLRKSSDAIQKGRIEMIRMDNDSIYAYKRSYGDEEIVCLHNFTENKLPIRRDFKDHQVLLSSCEKPDQTCLSPCECRILKKTA